LTTYSAEVELYENKEGYPIEFLINKSNDELWEIYSKAKIYWHASGFGEDLVKHPEFAEHFGISTVEAMGAGAVPVVINAGGQKEIVTEKINGLLWESLDELEEKTLSLINNKDLLMKLSKKAKERAKDFNDDNFSKKINQIINV
jgi:glycosyltransferase involved in cell wall biosynthesis